MNRRRTAPGVLPLWAVLLAASAPLHSQETLHLADLQSLAVARDPRSAQAQLAREQASLRLASLRAERLPSVGVSAQAQHQSDITSVNFPGARLPFKDTYDSYASARLRLHDPSRAPRRAVEDAQATEAVARVAVATFSQRLAVTDAWYAARTLQAQREVLATTLTDLDAQLRIARERVLAGAALPSDTALLIAERLRRRQSLDEVEVNRLTSLAILGDLAGRVIDTAATLAPVDLDRRIAALRQSIDTVRARPEYAAFAAARALTQAKEGALAAQDKPRLVAFTRTGYGRPGLNMLAREFDTYWLAGVQLEWAPFDWGVARRDREGLALQREVTATEERAFAERLRRTTLGDFATIERLTRALRDDEAIIALRERVLRETRLRHAEGVVTVADLIDRDTDLQVARLSLATHRVELEQASARVLTTLGLDVR